jgi:hypothetical protein
MTAIESRFDREQREVADLRARYLGAWVITGKSCLNLRAPA